jgi:hypothetical protein
MRMLRLAVPPRGERAALRSGRPPERSGGKARRKGFYSLGNQLVSPTKDHLIA